MKARFIENGNWGVAFKLKENEVPKKCVIYLIDKHLYSSVALNQILSNAMKYKKSYFDDVRYVSNMIKCWIKVRSVLLKTIPKVFECTKKPK